MSYAAQVLADSPLIYWRLGEASGTSAVDASGNGHDGTYSGAVVLGATGLIAGDADTAVTFDATGDDQFVKSDDDLGNTTYSTFTLECWFNLNGAHIAHGGTLIQLTNPANTKWILCYIDGSGHLHGGWKGSSSHLDGTDPIAGGATTHVVITYDGVDFIIYLNGAQATTQPIASDPVNFTGLVANLYVGGDNFGFDEGIFATIDEVAFYTTAISAARVAAHFSPPATPTVDSLTPSSGSTAGGNNVVIAGSALTDATDVDFGADPATSFVVDDDTQITAVAPAHVAGTVQVVVTTPGGSSG